MQTIRKIKRIPIGRSYVIYTYTIVISTSKNLKGYDVYEVQFSGSIKINELMYLFSLFICFDMV